jgi:hypothetical protein
MFPTFADVVRTLNFGRRPAKTGTQYRAWPGLFEE